ETWISNKEVVGVISIVYDHHKRQLVDEIVDVQHNYQNLIISSSHIHLDHHHCLEVIIVRGKASLINKLKDNLASMKGVQHTTLSVTSTI
ncbi:MAG: nickel-responsive transcriptional regulator NikR, partial [Endomicrobiia bacterium]